jgi:hypothetical protein
MREFELVIDNALKQGLYPEKVPFNSQFLSECVGFRCGKGGLEVHTPLTNPISSAIDMYYSWPFPQFITGERYNFLIIRDSTIGLEDNVYLVSPDHLTITYIFSVDQLTFGLGTLMEIADFGEYLFMTNGVIMIYWNVALNAWSQIVASANIPMMRTVCNFKGQAVGGGILSDWYDCDETFYVWSNIGYMNFVLGQDNEAGYRRCPYGGTVRNVRRLGDFVVGYSSKGIVLIHTVNELASTMGFKELSDIGIINQGAVNGNFNRHLYVGEDYILREVTAEGVKELGYQEFIKTLAGEDIIVSYDPSDKNFYIGNSTKTFLLSPYGLSEVLQHPSTVWRSNNSSHMLPEYVDDLDLAICSVPFNMTYGGQKTVFVIESDIHPAEAVVSEVDYTYDLATWFTGAPKPFNNQGISSNITSGNAFKFRLKFATLYDSTRIGYIKARYKMTDLRGIRGVYAPPPRGQ